MSEVTTADEYYTEEEIVNQIKDTFTGRQYEIDKVEKMNDNIYDVYLKDPLKRHNGKEEIKFEFFVTNRKKNPTK